MPAHRPTHDDIDDLEERVEQLEATRGGGNAATGVAAGVAASAGAGVVAAGEINNLSTLDGYVARYQSVTNIGGFAVRKQQTPGGDYIRPEVTITSNGQLDVNKPVI